MKLSEFMVTEVIQASPDETIAAAAQRVATSAHYPSDVLLGAALGLIGAAMFLGKAPDRPPPSA